MRTVSEVKRGLLFRVFFFLNAVIHNIHHARSYTTRNHYSVTRLRIFFFSNCRKLFALYDVIPIANSKMRSLHRQTRLFFPFLGLMGTNLLRKK